MKNIKIEDVYAAIINKFPADEYRMNGACWILPDGKFLSVHSHNEVDEFVCDEYNIDYDDYPYGQSIMFDEFNCIRVNDGSSFFREYYVTVPEMLPTADQFDSLSRWFDHLTVDTVDVGTTDGQMVTYNINEISSEYVVKRIKRYYSSGTLYEDL